MDKKGGPLSGHRRERGEGGGQKGPDKVSRPAAATLIRPPCYALCSHSKPTANPISMTPTFSAWTQTHHPLLWSVSSPIPQSSRVMPDARREIQLPERSEPHREEVGR